MGGQARQNRLSCHRIRLIDSIEVSIQKALLGQVMGILKPQLQGRADMSKVSQLIKSMLEGN